VLGAALPLRRTRARGHALCLRRHGCPARIVFSTAASDAQLRHERARTTACRWPLPCSTNVESASGLQDRQWMGSALLVGAPTTSHGTARGHAFICQPHRRPRRIFAIGFRRPARQVTAFSPRVTGVVGRANARRSAAQPLYEPTTGGSLATAPAHLTFSSHESFIH